MPERRRADPPSRENRPVGQRTQFVAGREVEVPVPKVNKPKPAPEEVPETDDKTSTTEDH